MDKDRIKEAIKSLRIETPSWGYGHAGTRFKTYKMPGDARTVHERIADAALVHRFTGVCPSVAVHIPWDKVDDYSKLNDYAQEQGILIGAVNPNVFQDDIYRLGSITNSEEKVRNKAVEAIIECIEVCKSIGSKCLSLWFADGTNYPGQGHFRKRKQWMEESLTRVYRELPDGVKMLIEYKVFEPAFYHTDLPDWGTAYSMATKLGSKAEVLVDTGHHSLGANIPHIVAMLLDEGKLGGFHFNDRKYADDDLIAGSIDPYQLFLIFNEIVDAGPLAAEVAYMVDQSHVIEPKVPALIRTVMNIQIAHAKSLLVDRDSLAEAQAKGDIIMANTILNEAFETDVRPLLAETRNEMGLAGDPLKEYLASGIQNRLEKERS